MYGHFSSAQIFFLAELRLDNEFTQLMKGLQGERLRQAFKYLDQDEDGLIRPDQFKRIILVSLLFNFARRLGFSRCEPYSRNLPVTNYLTP